jgi:broad specificity phosphatase PhoE
MADRPGVHETVRHLRLTLSRDVLIKQTTATTGEGVDELRETLSARWEGLDIGEVRADKQHAEAQLVAAEWVRACGAGNGTGDLRTAVKHLLEEAARTWNA